jgi:UDP-N-acetylmuramoyl-L-alanyl-D-glutamate--2,6-diaminopimelate ligase
MMLGEDKLNVLTGISSLLPVEGRFEYVISGNNITGIVDYAHTPDALQNVLSTINDIRTGNEKVITVFGCGGDRDAAKRPIMTKIACDMSDKVILTSDNPRSEDPEKIIEEMKTGIPPQHFRKTLAVTDRKEALRVACSLAVPGDIILVAGKGHEKYQEIKGVKQPFDDKQVLEDCFKIVES